MPNLRDMVDGTTIHAVAPVAMKPSPVAQQTAPKPPTTPTTVKAPKGKPSAGATHIADHLQDPLGSTKEGFQGLQQAKLQYDMAREEMQRNLAPVQSVISHVSQMHQIDPNQGTPGMGQPGMQNEDEEMAYDEDGNPVNMQQTAGKMNQSRPSMVGHQPGVAPGDGQTVRPPKLGMATPGQPNAQNSPQPKGSGGAQFGPAAKPPAGSKQLPGAKGPGDPKVANRTKSAQNKSSKSGGVNVTVHAAAVGVLHGNHTLETQFGLGTLLAGPAALSDKATGTGNALDYNPVMRSKGKRVAKIRTGKMKMCKACGEMHAEGKCMKGFGLPPQATTKHPSKPAFDAAGTSKGAKHRLATRNQKHLSAKEKKAHWEGMDAGGPGSGRRPGGSKKTETPQERVARLREKNSKRVRPTSYGPAHEERVRKAKESWDKAKATPAIFREPKESGKEPKEPGTSSRGFNGPSIFRER